MTFDDLGLSPDVLTAVKDAGYTTPTPIQTAAIPPALEGKDVLGIAQTGTGKTAAFSLPLIERLARGRARARMPRSLILEPTRELAVQVAEAIDLYTRKHRLSTALLIGGVSFSDQERKLDRGVDILIATPGRLLDHFERGKVMLSGVEVFVVDEADRMLDMGFIPDIERIFKLTPFTRQTLFFSATMPEEIRVLTEQFLHAPVRVEATRQATAAPTIKQSCCMVALEDKREALRQLVRSETITNAIVFCNTKRGVDILRRSLEKHGLNVGALHGDLDQRVRLQVLEQFRAGTLKLLIASDVAARGLDIPEVSHVFNFDVPNHPEDYVHRIGRTGRAGREGTAITIACPSERKALAAVEKLIGTTIETRTLPDFSLTHFSEADAEGTRSGRGRGRGRDRGERSEEPRRTAERAEQRTERPEPHPEPARHEPKPERASGEKRGRRRREDRDDDYTPVGLGDHVPAFLLRPTPLPRPKSTEGDGNGTESEAA